MKKVCILFAMTAFLILPLQANAQGNKEEGGLGKAIENVIDDVVGVFTGDESDESSKDTKSSGNENAVHQIDKNIEKHGGSHHGLENARRSVMKKDVNDIDGDGDKEELIEVIIEEIGDGVKEEIGVSEKPTWEKPARGKGKGKGPKK